MVEKKKTVGRKPKAKVSPQKNKKNTTKKVGTKTSTNKVDEKNVDMDKNELQEKVNVLISDVDDILSSGYNNKTKDIPKIEKKEESKTTKDGVEWLEKQIVSLNELNLKYENDLIDYKKKCEELEKKLQNKEGSNVDKSSDGKLLELKRNVIDIYRELLNSYTGKNNTGQKWSRVKIDYLLNKFRNKFDFI
jgi:preprotein translocase subunit SecD